LAASYPHAGDLFFLFFLCFAGLMLGHHGKTTWRTTRRRADTFSSKAESPRARRKMLVRIAPTRGWTRIYSRGALLVRGGNSSPGFSEGFLSCEAETPRSGFSVELLVRGGNYSCEAETPRRGFSEELLRESSRARRRVPVRTSLHRETPQERKKNCDK
jgi:hypothetical protein